MQSIPFYFAALVGLIVSHVHFASAYPNGAGTCEKGPAVLNSNSPHAAEDEGNWDASGYEVTVDGNTVTLEATGSSNFFRGFLFRLSSKDGSAADAMKRHTDFKSDSQRLESTSESIGNPATCSSDVAGISHTDNSKKTTMKVHLLLEQGITYKLDLTVVKKEHLWYYTSLKLSLSGDNTVTIVTGSKASSKNNSPTASPTAQETVASTATSTSATGVTSTNEAGATSTSESGAPSMGRDAGVAAKATASQASSGAVNRSPIVILATCFLIVMTCLSL